MVDLHCASAMTADQVMVIGFSQFIHDPAVARMRGQHKTIFSQKIQCTVDGGFGQPGSF